MEYVAARFDITEEIAGTMHIPIDDKQRIFIIFMTWF